MLIRNAPRILLHPFHPLVHFLKSIIIVRFELAHHTVIGIDRNLFFVINLKQSRMLLHDLGFVSH